MRLVRYSYPAFRTSAPAFQRSPWPGLEHEIDRWFSTALSSFDSDSGGRFPLDLYTDDNNTYVRAELPGFSRDDIQVELTDGYLTVSASRKTAEGKETTEDESDKTADESKTSRSYSVSRAVSVGDEVAADQVAANYENGVLTVTLPKREEAKPKKVTVAVK